MSTDPVHVTELVLRDGHQCLIATRLRTTDMLPVCARLDAIGYWSLEMWGGATFDACLRFLKEDPWERLAQLRAALPNTRLQMLLRGQNLLGYRHYPDDVVRAFVRRAAEYGMDVFRVFDAMNDARNMKTSIEAVKHAGKHAQGAICYTTSPVHSVAQFVALGRELKEMGCDSLAIKDMAGLLTPYVTGELTRALLQELGLPVHLHSHSCAGLAEMCQLKAIENGCRHINTAISSFSGGASHPSTESMVAALRTTPFDTGLDLVALQEIGFYFREVRKKYHQFESELTAADTRVQVNQVPGGMISNLYAQLREQGALNRLPEVLAEIPRVRADLGYPPLVTPTSQIVGAQAALNVLGGERYKSFTNEVKLYLQGRYGRTPGAVNAEVRRRAIGNEEVIECRPADLLRDELPRLTAEIGALASDEDDILSYGMFPEVAREFLRQRSEGGLQPEALEPPTQKDAPSTRAPVEFNVTLHGESYHIKVTGTGHKADNRRPYYLSVDGAPEEVLVETLAAIQPGAHSQHAAGEATPANHKGRPRATQPGHVTTSMPGTIVEVLVNPGDTVQAGDPVLVCEAMKMETEVQAPIAGSVRAVHVAKGDAVSPDEALIEIG
jgi:pyruvate carboxylase subunit B